MVIKPAAWLPCVLALLLGAVVAAIPFSGPIQGLPADAGDSSEEEEYFRKLNAIDAAAITAHNKGEKLEEERLCAQLAQLSAEYVLNFRAKHPLPDTPKEEQP